MGLNEITLVMCCHRVKTSYGSWKRS